MQERLEREFNIDLITTAPGVRYRVTNTVGEILEIDNPTRFPDPSEIKQIEEPIIDAMVITQEEFLGGILKLLEEKRGTQKKFEYIGGGRVMLTYEMPLNEIVLDFYDRLKDVYKRQLQCDSRRRPCGRRRACPAGHLLEETAIAQAEQWRAPAARGR